MNLFNGANRISNGESLKTPGKSDSENSLPRDVISSWTQQVNSAIIPVSSSDPEESTSLKRDAGNHTPDPKEKRKVRKSLQFTLSREPQEKFGDPPKQWKYRRSSPRGTPSQPLSPKSRSVERSISKAVHRMRKIRAKNNLDNKEDLEKGSFTIPTTPTNRRTALHDDPIIHTSDDDIIVDKDETSPEMSNTPTCDLASQFSSSNLSPAPSSAFIDVSDDESSLPLAKLLIHDRNDDNVSDIQTIESSENELDNKMPITSHVKTMPRTRSQRHRNTSDRDDDCVIVEVLPRTAEIPKMNASLQEQEDRPGIETFDQPKRFRQHIPGGSEKDVCGVDQQMLKLEDRAREDQVSSDLDIKPHKEHLIKPCWVNLGADKKDIEQHFLQKKRDKELKEVERIEDSPLEHQDVPEVPNEEATSASVDSSSHKTVEKREEDEEIVPKVEKQLSVEKKKRGRKAGVQLTLTVAKSSSSSDKPPEDGDKMKVEEPGVESQVSGEKKKRGRKPGFKLKPKVKNKPQMPIPPPQISYQHSSIVGGIIFNTMSKTQADAKALKSGESRPVEKKKRGRKPGGKNKPKVDRGRDLKTIVKRPKRQNHWKSKLNINNNEIVVPQCCFERTCCHVAGCSHGNNHKKLGRLPSLPENTDFFFVEQLYQDNVQKIKERMLAEGSNGGTAAETSEGNDRNADEVPKAIIQFPLEVVANGEKSTGKEVLGFTVPLQPCLSKVDVPNSENLQVESPKPKIVQDEMLPKGTINHVRPKQLNAVIPPSTDSPGPSKRENFGIRSTIPSRRCLNPSADTKAINEKILSTFSKIWSKIPEIAALMESPLKDICPDESSDAGTMEHVEELVEMRPSERRKSHLSDSINNTDLKNGHVKTSAVLNGLFSDPHLLLSSGKGHQESDRSETTQQTSGKALEKKLKNKPTTMSRLSKEKVALMDKSTDAQDGIDVMSHIMRQMQMPGKPVFPPLAPVSPPKVSKKSSEVSNKRENSLTSVNSRKRVAETSVESLETKKKKVGGQWSLNDPDTQSATSLETRLSDFASHPSRSSYLLSIIDRKTPTGKEELIQAWLSKDAGDSKDSEDSTSIENAHSPHSAKTCVRTPKRDDDTDREETVDVSMERPNDSQEGIDECGRDSEKDELTRAIGATDLCSASSSSNTVSNSLVSSSGIGTEQEKQSSVEAGDGDDEAQVSTASVSQGVEGNNNSDDDGKEDEDALFLDVDDDDYMMEEPPEKKDNKGVKVRQPPKMSSPIRADPPAVINPNESPRRRTASLKIPVVDSSRKSSQAPAKLTDWDEDDAATSGLYEMSNVDRYCSQTRREFSIEYSRVDDPDAYDPGDVDDVYEPVQSQGERILFPKDAAQFFRGLCYAYLKKGTCTRLDCPFDNNKYSYYLQNLPKAPPAIIEIVLNYAIKQQYYHALSDIYPEAVKALPLQPIQRVCAKIRVDAENHKTKAQINYQAYRFYQESMKPTVAALSEKNHSPATIIDILSKGYLLRDDDDMKKLMRVLIASKKIPPGHHWDTFKDLIKLLKSSPPQFLVSLILDDCIRFDKSREYLANVYEHVIKRIPEPTLQGIDAGLLRPFRQFSEALDKSLNRATVAKETSRGNTTPMPDVEMGFHEEQHCPQIASPDDVPRDDHYLGKKEKEMTISDPRRRSVKDRLGTRDALIRPRTGPTRERLDLIPIDRISRPNSLYREFLWPLHCDLKTIQLSLKHRAYDRVIETLSSAKKRISIGTQPFAKGFYHILCKEIITSADHLEAIIKRSVQTRRYKVLPVLFEVGTYLLIKLTNDGLWIIAYRLLRILRRLYGIKEAPKYYFFIADIFIGNRRPLQALALLNQYKLISKHRNKWTLRSHSQDKSLRILVLGNLITSLCRECPRDAFKLFKKVLQQQITSYEPIDLSKCADEICKSLLVANKTEELIKMANLIVQRNLNIRRATLRTLIATVFHSDICLSRQLHQYATLIGLYPVINIHPLTCSRVDCGWTEEEMFLQIFSLFRNIRDSLGSAVDRIIPERMLIYLNFEITADFGGRRIITHEYNGIILTRAKERMDRALKRFNSPINIAQDLERILKLSSETVATLINSEDFIRLAETRR
ncbi:uncharacterized protein LOC135168696 isoform X2 [Diachasmimorpha longicaudata]|uniref:uncharacterized protein LOC135168696 isoform X2 n=1 Tax=Diachasmimorpha longicaudata TaxID=58733 RepID=UPI0030B90733